MRKTKGAKKPVLDMSGTCSGSIDVPYTVGGKVVWRKEPCNSLALPGEDLCFMCLELRKKLAKAPDLTSMINKSNDMVTFAAGEKHKQENEHVG